VLINLYFEIHLYFIIEEKAGTYEDPYL